MQNKNSSQRISIITVTLNCFDTIEETIKSVIRQNRYKFEYIIVDGGSTDGTLEVIMNYSAYISYWISEPDDGVYFAMNKGLKVAKGDYVYYLNSGDYLLEGVIDKVCDCLERNDIDVLYGNVVHGKNGRVFSKPLESIYWTMPMCHQSVFMRRNCIDAFNTEYRVCADYDLLYRVYLQGRVFRYYPIDVAYYAGGGISDNLIACARERCNVSCTYWEPDNHCSELYRDEILDYYVGMIFDSMRNDGLKIEEIQKTIKDYFGKYEEIICWGTGDIAHKNATLIESLGSRICYFVDNDETKWGKKFLKYDIRPVVDLCNEKNKCIFVFNERYCENIKLQVLKMNLDSTIVLDDYINLMCTVKEQYKGSIISEGIGRVPNLKKVMES